MLSLIGKKYYFLFLILVFNQCTKSVDDIVPISKDLMVSFIVDKNEVILDSLISFTSSSSDTESEIVSWSWDFADGTPMNFSKNVTHSFNLPGSYLVKLTIRNKLGKTADFARRMLVRNSQLPDFGNLVGLKNKLTLLYPKVIVAAHRGYKNNFQENSVEALIDAAKYNINIVELDVRLTADKELIIMHDASTARTTNLNVNVVEKTLSEIKQLRLMHNGITSNYTVPTLRECLEAAKGKIYITIDASKNNSDFFFNKIYNTVASLNMTDMVIIYTTSSVAAANLLKMDGSLNVLLGAGSSLDYNNASNMTPKVPIWHLATTTLFPLYTNGPTNSGTKFWANAYVNSNDSPPLDGGDAVVSNLIANQVSLIQTDYPLEIIAGLQKQNLWLK